MTEKNKVVVIDGVEYVPRKVGKKGEIVCSDRFPADQEAKMHESLKQAGYGFFCVQDCISERDAAETDFMVMDAANVCMVAGKTVRAKLFLRRYISVEETPKKVPDWDYSKILDNQKGKESRGKYGFKGLRGAIKFFEAAQKKWNDEDDVDGFVWLKLKRDFPITFEDDDFIFSIAPRIENE